MKCLLISLCYAPLHLFSHYLGKEGRGGNASLVRDGRTSPGCVASASWLQVSKFGSHSGVSLSLSGGPLGSLTPESLGLHSRSLH